jgi:hypothetical protein
VIPFTSEELRMARRESRQLYASTGGNSHKFSDLKTLICGLLFVITFLQFAKTLVSISEVQMSHILRPGNEISQATQVQFVFRLKRIRQ